MRLGVHLLCSLLAAATVFAALPLSAATPPDPKAAPGTGVDALGAKGDGQTDDTAAIQRAVDQGPGVLRFPRGTYRITSPIVIELDRVGWTAIAGDGVATLQMAGAGPALHFRGTHAGTADPKSVKDNVWLRQRTPLVDGLEIVGDHPEAIGLQIEGTMQATLSRLTVRKALHGVLLTGRNRNVLVSECHLYENRGVGLLLEKLNLHQVNVCNCHISYNAGGGIVVRGSEIRNLQIGTCDIEANMADDVPPTANVLLDVREGSVREGAIVGCTLQHGHKAIGSANIRFLGPEGKPPLKVGLFAISANLISDTDLNVHLLRARGVTLSANNILEGGTYNLLVDDCSQIVVGANLFDRHPDYRAVKGQDQVVFRASTDCMLSGAQINGVHRSEAGLLIEECQRFNITGCTVLDCDGYGILLKNVSRSRLAHCLVRDDRPASERQGAASQAPIHVIGGQENQIEAYR